MPFEHTARLEFLREIDLKSSGSSSKYFLEVFLLRLNSQALGKKLKGGTIVQEVSHLFLDCLHLSHLGIQQGGTREVLLVESPQRA